MDDRHFFDKLAPHWDENEVLSTAKKVNEILDYMDLKRGQDVLDLGTGTGVLLPHIAQRIGAEGSITAIDYSREMLKIAHDKFGSLNPAPEFHCMDFEQETISGEFHRIILYCVYPHLHFPVDTLRWLTKVNLADGGKLFIAFPCNEDFINDIHKERHSESDMLPSAVNLALYLNNHGLKAKVLASGAGAYVVEVTV